jgi:hypothetical protein
MVERIHLNAKKARNFGDAGHRKPPGNTQFKPGRSGNPAGRPKGTRNFKTELRATLQTPVKINKGGRGRKVSTQRASLMVLSAKALNGDQRAIEHLIGLALRIDDEPNGPATAGLDSNDRAILDAYLKDAIAQADEAASHLPIEMSRIRPTIHTQPMVRPNERDCRIVGASPR